MVVVLLPGAWVTCGLPLTGVSLGVRLAAGIMLSPVVVFAQFTILRVLGVSFPLTVILLVLLNLPALYFVARRAGNLALPSRRVLWAALAVTAVPMALLAVRFHNPHVRAYYGHGWMHADVIYTLATGDVRPEEPELAGVRLGYPWAGHGYQGVLSHLLDSSPVSSFTWTNVIWLLGIFTLVAATVRALGGGPYAGVAAVAWLAFGVNFVGYIFEGLVPQSVREAYPIWGAWRYTPWLRKFYGFDQMALALGLFAALAYFSSRRWPRVSDRDHLVIIGLLLCGLGMLYPILFPAGCAVVGAKAVAIFLTDREEPPQLASAVVALGLVVLISAAVTFVHLHIVTVDRQGGGLVELDTLWNIKLKSASSVIALFPLWLGLGFVFPRLWRVQRGPLAVLCIASLGSVLLYVLFHIPNARNEYKYILTAAILLAPFPSLALAPLLGRLHHLRIPALVALALVLAAPAAHRMQGSWPGIPSDLPPVDATDFALRLEDDHPYEGVARTLRSASPANTVVLAAQTPVHLPTLTGRRLYAPYENRQYTGVGLRTDYLLTRVKGYDATLLRSRRADLHALFESTDDAAREDALHRIRAIDRPLAIVVDTQTHEALLTWISGLHRATQLYDGAGLSVWLVAPDDASVQGRNSP
jgi:hypothetical protein